MRVSRPKVFAVAFGGWILAGPGMAEDGLRLSSPAMADGGVLPDDLKCPRDDGDGLSPPLDWSGVPSGTQSLAAMMYHDPKGRLKG